MPICRPVKPAMVVAIVGNANVAGDVNDAVVAILGTPWWMARG
jgi:hypothetical protein